MATEPFITLYETARKDSEPWNPLSLRARFILDFKGLPYKTVQIEYPDIEPTMRKIGAAPTANKPNGQPYYTVPVIADSSRRMPDGSPMIVSDSWAIAGYLDDAYPSTAQLFPQGTKALQALFLNHFNDTVFLPGSVSTVALALPLLNEASQGYWRATREGYFGGKLEDICPKGSPKWKEVWETVLKGLSDIATLIDTNKTDDGPFVMGDTASFVDIALASTLEAVAVLIPEEWENIKRLNDGKWDDFMTAWSNWKATNMN